MLLLDDLEERKKYPILDMEALDRSLLRTLFG